MNFEQLKTLNSVVESGSITEAAKRLHKTQPALSMMLKKLEQDLGFSLFDRSGYRLQLTEKGKIYVEKSQLVLTQMAQLQNMSEAFSAGVEHQVKIAIEDICDASKLFADLPKVQQLFPDTQLNFVNVLNLHSLAELKDEKVDLALSPWLVNFEGLGDFETKRVDKLEFSFCIHKDLAARHNIFKLSDITEESLYHVPQITPNELGLELQETKLLKKISRSIIKVDDIQIFMLALQHQLGWGPMTGKAWTDEMAENYFRFYLDSEQSMDLADIRLVKNRNKILGPCAQAIWDLI